MKKITSTLLPVAMLLVFFAVPSTATLVGTSVNGSLTFGGDPSNYLDPAYGFVPATGYLNLTGTAVTVSNSAVEFGFDDGASLISADFSDSRLSITDLTEVSGATNSFEMIFSDAAFAGQYLIPVSDSFPFQLRSVAGSVLALDYLGGNSTLGQTRAATFVVSPVPEPSPALLLSMSLVATLALFFGRSLRLRSRLCGFR